MQVVTRRVKFTEKDILELDRLMDATQSSTNNINKVLYWFLDRILKTKMVAFDEVYSMIDLLNESQKLNCKHSYKPVGCDGLEDRLECTGCSKTFLIECLNPSKDKEEISLRNTITSNKGRHARRIVPVSH
jgi:hypothetical protein